MMLRPLDPKRDGPDLHLIFGDPQSCLYLPEPAFSGVEETIGKLTEWTRSFEDTSWAVCETADGPALGRIAFYTKRPDVWEAACMICPEVRGRGLAEWGLARGLDYLFDEKQARRVFADIDPDHGASIRTFEKLGFQKEGVLRGEWKTHLGVRDAIIMGLLASDPRPWRAL